VGVEGDQGVSGALPMTTLDTIASQQELPLEGCWAAEVAEIVGSSREHGKRFTGQRLAKGDPEKYMRIVKLRTCGMTVREVAAIEKVSPQTVTAIMRVEAASRTADEYRGEMAADLAVAAKMSVEALLELLADEERRAALSGRDLAFMLEKLTEKRELLTGGATHRNEPVKSEQERLEEARRHVSQARELLDGGVIVDVE